MLYASMRDNNFSSYISQSIDYLTSQSAVYIRYQTSSGPVQKKRKVASPLEKFQQFSLEQSTSFQQDFVTWLHEKKTRFVKKIPH